MVDNPTKYSLFLGKVSFRNVYREIKIKIIFVREKFWKKKSW